MISVVLRKVSEPSHQKRKSHDEKFRQQAIIGTLRSNDADGNENIKKTIDLISKTTTSHVHHTFLFISFPFLNDYDVKKA